MSEHRPIRILQVGMSPTYGGTEAFVMEQYRHIDRGAVQFDFLNVFSEALACQDEIESLGGKIYHLNMSRREGMRQYHANLDAFFRENHHRFQGVHCNYQSLINIDILAYSKKYQIPIRIAHAHNSGYGHEPTLVQKAIIMFNKHKVKRCATHYCACSTLAAHWMFPKNVETTVIHNAIDVKKFGYSEDLRTKKRRELNISDGTLVVFFAGRLDPQKNPLFLIEVFENLLHVNKNSLLLIAGDGYMRGEVESKVSEKGLGNKVKLLGNRSDVHELMQAADAFLFPSRFEGLGIVLIEAQAAGLPCFSSKNVVPAEVNVTGNVHFISLHDSPKAWANYILQDVQTAPVRKDESLTISQSGYNSESAVLQLQNIYLNTHLQTGYGRNLWNKSC